MASSIDRRLAKLEASFKKQEPAAKPMAAEVRTALMSVHVLWMQDAINDVVKLAAGGFKNQRRLKTLLQHIEGFARVVRKAADTPVVTVVK